MRALLLAALLAATPALAGDLRDLCPDRPGLDTPPCIVDKGHVLVEAGLGDWQHDRTATTVTDTVTAGDLLARVGVTDHLELFAGWTAYGHERVRDRPSGTIRRRHGTGDVTLGFKQSLLNPGGDGASIAVQGFVTAPTGTSGFGAGGWTEGILVPLRFALPAGFTLALTPEAERSANTQRRGHHAQWTMVGGIGHDLGQVSAQVELLVSRDDDPGARTTQALAGLNLSWQPADSLQLDAEVDAGLNRDAPDVRIALGLSRRF